MEISPLLSKFGMIHEARRNFMTQQPTIYLIILTTWLLTPLLIVRFRDNHPIYSFGYYCWHW